MRVVGRLVEGIVHDGVSGVEKGGRRGVVVGGEKRDDGNWGNGGCGAGAQRRTSQFLELSKQKVNGNCSFMAPDRIRAPIGTGYAHTRVSASCALSPPKLTARQNPGRTNANGDIQIMHVHHRHPYQCFLAELAKRQVKRCGGVILRPNSLNALTVSVPLCHVEIEFAEAKEVGPMMTRIGVGNRR